MVKNSKLSTLIDITELKVQDNSFPTIKMASMGDNDCIIAHQWRQPLSVK